MKKRFFPLLITLSALTVSGSAAFYSVFGLSKLFAGASLQVIIMAGSLEFAKLVVASLLYQYWDTINKFLRTYLAIAVFVLMIITSGGIYGFLSGAYQETATKSELLDKSLVILNQKQVRFEETKQDLVLEKNQINKSISDLRVSLASPGSVSYWDENSQTVITTTSSSTRRALQSELKTTITDRDNLNIKLEAILDSITTTDLELLNKEISNEDERELGPLKYLAETTGQDMGQVVNWFLLLIVFVFDPLAIALVVAANFAFNQIRKPEDDVVDYGEVELRPLAYKPKEKVVKLEKQDVVMDDMEDVPRKELDSGEKRMNIIGQNGNDGLHYSNVITTTDNLTNEEIQKLSREIAKTEKLEEDKPINPKVEDLEKLAKALNITYNDDDVQIDRLTDTTQTLLIKNVDKTEGEEIKSGTKLKYKGRK